MPEEKSKIIVGMEEGIPHFLPWGGGREEIIDFLITVPFPAEEGEEVTSLLLGDDVILDIEVTANRGDCLSSLGVAREVGAKLDLKWQIPRLLMRKPILLLISVWKTRHRISVLIIRENI